MKSYSSYDRIFDRTRYRLRAYLKRFAHMLIPDSQRNRISSQTHGRVTYSQCGEDSVVDYILRLKGVGKISYLDIGGYDPFLLSNTALFYTNGSSGVIIEPNAAYASRFRQLRPRDTVCQMAIGPSKGKLEYFCFNDPTLNTASKDEMLSLLSLGYILVDTIEVAVMTINDIIAEYFNSACPDLISLDAEGMDFEIIKTLDFLSYRPRVICMETARFSPVGRGTKIEPSIEFLESQGYIEYAFTGLNSIFIESSFWLR